MSGNYGRVIMSLRWRSEGWRKLYVREEGSFAQLPLYVRALAAELLKAADSRGRIECRGKEPWRAIAWRMGATRGDRRMLQRDIPLLIKDGYLVVDPATGDVIIRNFLSAHPHLAVEGVDRIPVADLGPGAPVVDLVPAQVAPMSPPHTVPAVDSSQLGLFSWTPPPPGEVDVDRVLHLVEVAGRMLTDATRPVRDDATTVQRKSTQPVETPPITPLDQRSEESEREKRRPPAPERVVVPEGDEVGRRRVAQQLADLHERERERAAGVAGALYVPMPMSELAGRFVALLDAGWGQAALEVAISATAHEACTKRTLIYFNGADNLRPDAVKRAIARAPARRSSRPAEVTSAPAAAPPISPPTCVPPGTAATDDLEQQWKAMGLNAATIASLRARSGGG